MDEKLEQTLRYRMRELRDKMTWHTNNNAREMAVHEAKMERYRSEIDWIDKVLNEHVVEEEK